MLRRLRLALAATPFVLSLLHPLPAFADTAIALDCADGSPLSATVDAATLTKLEGAVQAMIDNPSGMTCLLTQPAMADPLSIGGGAGDYVVGGGRYGREAPNCPFNFSLSGHVDQSLTAHGTQTATENNTNTSGPNGCPGQGHIKANVTCVAVSGNLAEVRGDIMEQSGSLSPQFFPQGSTVMVTDVQDNGSPSSGVPDLIQQWLDVTGTDNACVPGFKFTGFPCFCPPSPVDNGNVTVRD